MIGKVYSRKYFYASLNIGLGIIFGQKFQFEPNPIGWGDEKETKKSIFPIGIPFEIDIKFIPFKNLGLGSSIIGNMNKDFTWIGINFNISLGNLRGK